MFVHIVSCVPARNIKKLNNHETYAIPTIFYQTTFNIIKHNICLKYYKKKVQKEDE